MLCCCGFAVAQTTVISGTVKDALTGEPIPFANVAFKGTFIGVNTDMDGHYAMETLFCSLKTAW